MSTDIKDDVKRKAGNWNMGLRVIKKEDILENLWHGNQLNFIIMLTGFSVLR